MNRALRKTLPTMLQVKESRAGEGVLPQRLMPTLSFSASAYMAVICSSVSDLFSVKMRLATFSPFLVVVAAYA